VRPGFRKPGCHVDRRGDDNTNSDCGRFLARSDAGPRDGTLLPSTLGTDLPEEGTVAVPAQPAIPLFLILTALKLRQSFVDTMLVSLTFSLLSVPREKSTDSLPIC